MADFALVHTQALILAGRNGTYKIGPDPGIKDQWQRFMGDFGKIDGQVGYKAYGVCHNFDGKGQMDYLCAVQVKDEGQVPGYLFTMTVPARKVAVFAHDGDVATISSTWDKIFSTWLPEANLKVAHGPQFEIYGDDFKDDQGRIEIHIPVD